MGWFNSARQEYFEDILVKHHKCIYCDKTDHEGNMVRESHFIQYDKEMYENRWIHLECGLLQYDLKVCPCKGRGFIPIEMEKK